MDRGDIIAVVFGAVVVLAAVICVFYAKMRKSKGQDIAPSIADASGSVDHAQPLPRFTTVTIEQIHRKYDDLAETDPILAGKLKYAELLQHHGE